MSDPPRRSAIAFGPFGVNVATGELFRNGRRVRLDDKAFQVLVALLERPGEVVSRDDLKRRLWSENVVVEFDKNLNNAVRRVREALGDSADRPQYVETLSRRGYRFVGLVEPDRPLPVHALTPAPVHSPSNDSHRWWHRRVVLGATTAILGALLIGMVLVWNQAARPIASIVVLPFESVDEPTDSRSSRVAFGITDLLTSELSQLKGLRVVSATTARWYRDARKTIPEIVQELGVDAIVEGTVVQEGEHLRVTVQLIDGRTDSHTWSQTFNRQSHSLVALQNEIARAVVDSLPFSVSPNDIARIAAARRVDPAVQEDYLEGRYYLSLGTEPDRERARLSFEKALQKDPTHAPAYVGLADVLNLSERLAPSVAIPKAKAYALKALELDGTLPAAHASLGYIHYYGDWDWKGAEDALERAIALDPNDVRAIRWYGRVLGATGRTADALHHTRLAVQLDPMSIVTLDSAAAEEFRARHHDRGLDLARRILGIDSDDARGFEHLAINFAQKGQFDECLAAAEHGSALSERAPHFLVMEVYCLGRLHRAADAEARKRELETLARTHYVPEYFLAVAAIGAGSPDEAVRWLQRGYEGRDTFLVELKTSPWLDAVRTDPRVRRLEQTLGFPQ